MVLQLSLLELRIQQLVDRSALDALQITPNMDPTHPTDAEGSAGKREHAESVSSEHIRRRELRLA